MRASSWGSKPLLSAVIRRLERRVLDSEEEKEESIGEYVAGIGAVTYQEGLEIKTTFERSKHFRE